jgi:hypothetical protein
MADKPLRYAAVANRSGTARQDWSTCPSGPTSADREDPLARVSFKYLNNNYLEHEFGWWLQISWIREVESTCPLNSPMV